MGTEHYLVDFETKRVLGLHKSYWLGNLPERRVERKASHFEKPTYNKDEILVALREHFGSTGGWSGWDIYEPASGGYQPWPAESDS